MTTIEVDPHQPHPTTQLLMSELLAAVEDSGHTRLAGQQDNNKKRIPKVLEPDPGDAYIYIDGKFVRNPKYKAPTGQDRSRKQFCQIWSHRHLRSTGLD